MEWSSLLNASRLGQEKDPTPVPADQGRNEFQRDHDRVTYSSAFRRMQDKTQVFPLANTDYVRTRLTHSLEVSSLGRSFGLLVGKRLREKHKEGFPQTPAEIGDIVAASCLAHDIGNPPFGHSGESAISDWFGKHKSDNFMEELTDAQRQDFLNFEGNAQGFRILAKLQMPANPGMQLTCATMAAYSKYPCGSDRKNRNNKISMKKFGYFQSEKDVFLQLANRVGMTRCDEEEGAFCRHPLAFLMEAADDICYRIIDFEDGFKMRLLTFEEVANSFESIIGEPGARNKYQFKDGKESVEYLRAKAINRLLNQCVEVFVKNEDEIVGGNFEKSLIDEIELKPTLDSMNKLQKEKVFLAPMIQEIEYAGFNVVRFLLDEILIGTDYLGAQKNKKCILLLSMYPSLKCGDNVYTRIQHVTDWISGMSDSYAVSVHQQLSGMSLRQF